MGISIIGFRTHHYRYKSDREGEWFLAGCFPRKIALTIYLLSGFVEKENLLKLLGKYKTGKACLYIKKLENIDKTILRKIITASVKQNKWNKKK